MEHLQWMWHASGKRLPLRTPGSAPSFGDFRMLQLLSPVFPNLPRFFLDFSPRKPLDTLDFAFNTNHSTHI